VGVPCDDGGRHQQKHADSERYDSRARDHASNLKDAA
jgi:hypothetical protein